jgi:AcrR family transcriptional regulator
MEASGAPTARVQRADARRNRESILAAARTAFAEAGVDAQMEDVARRAGVGVGTVYRHFPTKEALIGELLDQKFRLLLEGARLALDVEDPWEAFAGTLRRNAELMAADAAVQDALMRADAGSAFSYAGESREELKATFAIVIERAKAAGVVRPDFTIEDIPLLMCGLSSTMAAGAAGGRFDWRRHLELMLDGVRAR